MFIVLPLMLLAVEAHEVVGLRMMKISSGGPGAISEMQLMVAEKMDAVAEASKSLICGETPMGVVARVRERVAHNRRRLLD